MKPLRTLLGVVLPLALGACASSAPIHYFSLDDGSPAAIRPLNGFSVAVTQVNLPDVIDRPQLVVRTAKHQLRLDDQHEWAEPLRRQLPRVIARHLGAALDSGRVFALPVDAQSYDPDFKVMLDIQRLEVISGECVELDAVWRVEPRNGKAFFGRSVVQEDIQTMTEPGGGYAMAVAAQNRALRRLAKNIVSEIARWPNEKAADGCSTDRNASRNSPPSCLDATQTHGGRESSLKLRAGSRGDGSR